MRVGNLHRESERTSSGWNSAGECGLQPFQSERRKAVASAVGGMKKLPIPLKQVRMSVSYPRTEIAPPGNQLFFSAGKFETYRFALIR
jgi:hypothetical protein